MRLKSYFATTVEAAMTLARQELGPDAMLMHSRRTSTQDRHMGEYEVVFALLPEGPAANDERPAPSSCDGPDRMPRGEPVDKLTVEVADLKRQIERLAGQFTRVRMMTPARRMGAFETRLLSSLLNAEVHETLAEEIVNRALEAGPSVPVFPDVLMQIVRFDPSLGKPGRPRKIVALVGPPASGKTTTLVKLAARFGLGARRPAQIISTDTFRIGATDQLRAYAAILGIGFQAVESTHGLSVAFDEHRHKELILIDTPGLAPSEMSDGAGLAAELSANPEIDVHLVIPASMRSGDLALAVERYAPFGSRKLIFTRMDEARNAGSVLNEAVRSRIPISFVTHGQQIPEDLTPASGDIFAPLFDALNPVEPAPAMAQIKRS